MKKLIAVILSLAIMASLCIPAMATFTLEGTDPTCTISMTEEAVEGQEGIKKLVVKVQAQDFVSAVYMSVMSYDSDCIVPVSATNSYSELTITDGLSNKEAFTAGSGYSVTGCKWKVNAEIKRVGFNITVSTSDPSNGTDISSETEVFSFYYKIKDESKMNKQSIRLDLPTTEGTFLTKFYTTDKKQNAITITNKSSGGSAIYFGSKTSTDNAGVSLTYTGSTNDALTDVKLVSVGDTNVPTDPDKIEIPVPKATKTANNILVAQAIGLDGEYAGVDDKAATISYELVDSPTGVSIGGDNNDTLVITSAAAGNTFDGDNKCTIQVKAIANVGGTEGTTKECTTDIVLTKETSALSSITVSKANDNDVEIPADAASGTPATLDLTIAYYNQYGGSFAPANATNVSVVKAGTTDTVDGVTAYLIDKTQARLSVTNGAKENITASQSFDIKVTNSNVTGTATVTVKRADSVVTSLEVEPQVTDPVKTVLIPADGAADATFTFGATIKDQYSAVMSSEGVTWSIASAKKDGIEINSSTGTITVSNKAKESIATSADVTVQATSNTNDQKSANVTLTVKRAASVGTSIVWYKGESALTKGETDYTDTIVIPQADSTTVTYKAQLRDQYGADMAETPEVSMECTPSASASPSGAELSIEVESGASPEVVTAKATYSSIEQGISVNVVDIQPNWLKSLNLDKGTAYGTKTNEELVTEKSGFEGKLYYSLGASEVEDPLTGEFTIEEGYTDYEGTISVSFTVDANDASSYKGQTFTTTLDPEIVRYDISGDRISTSGIVDKEYTGSTIAQTFTVSDSRFDGNLALTTDYTYEITNNTNAAKSDDAKAPTVTITGVGNYTGTRTDNFTIKPMAVSVTDTTFTAQTYNGSATINTGNIVPAFSSALVEQSDYEISDASFTGTDAEDAGNNKPYTYTVTLLDPNFCFDNSTSTYVYNKTVTAANGKIDKVYLSRSLPSGEITVYYKADGGEFDIANLKGTPDGWKDAKFADPGVSTDNDSIINSVSCTDSKVTFEITKTAAYDKSATITVYVKSKNYATFEATITVKTVNIDIPWPTNGNGITVNTTPVYGTSNEEILTGFETGTVNATTSETITGKFSVKNPDTVLDAKDTVQTVTLVFTPAPGQSITTSFEKTYEVTVQKKALTVTPNNVYKTFGDSDPELTYSVTGTVGTEEAAFNDESKLARETGENVGTYAISAGDLALKDNGAFKASNYTLTVATGKYLTISAKSISNATLTANNPTYNGTAQTPAVTVDVGATQLTSADFDVKSYSNNINAGTASFTVEGKGNYTGTASGQFTIYRMEVEDYMVSDVTPATVTYNGKQHTPTVTLTTGAPVESTDYKLTWGDNINAGTGYVYVNFYSTGNYTRTPDDCISKIFTIVQANLIDLTLEVSGEATEGETLTAEVKNSSGDTMPQSDFNYQWYVYDGDEAIPNSLGTSVSGATKIEDATQYQYTLTSDEVGMRVFCEITTSSSNYTNGSEGLVSAITDEIEEEDDEVTVTFETNGGTKIKSLTLTAGTAIRMATFTTTKAGFTFDGWYENKKLTRAASITEVITRNTTFYAKWSPIVEEIKTLPFTDVTDSDWFFDYIYDLYTDGVVNGYPDNTYRPKGNVTYGEVLKLIMKAVGYSDVQPTGEHWASGYLAIASGLGWLNSNVDLDAPITRGALAEIAAKAIGLSKSTIASPFEDAAPNSALALYEAGIITGSLDNGHLLFRADSNITRAEIAAIIWRLIQK